VGSGGGYALRIRAKTSTIAGRDAAQRNLHPNIPDIEASTVPEPEHRLARQEPGR
jgi:hypothetical protein